MSDWKRRLGTLFLALALMLAWSGGAVAWIEDGPGDPKNIRETDPDDFPLVDRGHDEVRIEAKNSPNWNAAGYARLMIFLARFM